MYVTDKHKQVNLKYLFAGRLLLPEGDDVFSLKKHVCVLFNNEIFSLLQQWSNTINNPM